MREPCDLVSEILEIEKITELELTSDRDFECNCDENGYNPDKEIILHIDTDGTYLAVFCQTCSYSGIWRKVYQSLSHKKIQNYLFNPLEYQI
jgi:hypothetical protein